MSNIDGDDYFDIFPVFCTAMIPAEVLDEFLTKGHNPENEDWYPGGSFYLMKSETEDPFGIVRPSQPPVQAFESPFISWPVKRIFEHFKANYYEPLKDVDSPDAPKIAGHNCVILDERTLSDGTCLLVSDTPAGDLYDKDLPHTARCEVGFALCVLGDCEIMNGNLVEYNMNYGDNPDHVLRDNDDGDGAMMIMATTTMTAMMTMTMTMTMMTTTTGRRSRKRRRTMSMMEKRKQKIKKGKMKRTSRERKVRRKMMQATRAREGKCDVGKDPS